MNFLRSILFILVMIPIPAFADFGASLDPLPCGIYDQSVKALIEKDLETQNRDASHYTMGTTTKSGKKISVQIKSVETAMMSGERNEVTVFLDGKPLAKTSHQDVPLYLEVYVDNEKYRIICVRINTDSDSDEDGTEKGKQTKLFVLHSRSWFSE